MQPNRFSYLCVGLTVYSVAVLATSASQVILPKPSGFYNVGRSVTELIDNSRTQPFAPDVEPRRLMITVFYPVIPLHPATRGPYMPPETARIEDGELSADGLAAPNGTFERVALHLASNESIQNLTHRGPLHSSLVLFMPAEGTTRLFYSQIASTIASNGYTVVTIDAPYDVDVVEYPDGSIASFNQTLWGTNDTTALAQTAYTAIETRVEDVSFVLDSLSNTTLAHSLIPNLPPHSDLNTTHTAMIGHSLGGSTAFSILEADDRVLGGLNMDSGLYGPGLLNGTAKPFMIMAHANHTRDNQADDPFLTWAQAWPYITGWKRDVIVAETLHYDFSDYPILFETLGITPSEEIAQGPLLLVGSMEGTRALHLVTSYVGAFLDFVLHGKESALLDGPVEEFPEVMFED
ncbi:hypothetical protein MMC14_006402 [Varicellaria rhodocarpa]|nr:hypothetical protein [Varicellaria rhodocarpa]